MSGSRRYAVIDVGTNMVRLLVAEQADGRLTPVHTDKQLVRLGRDLAHDGRIGDESLLHVGDALRRFATVAKRRRASPTCSRLSSLIRLSCARSRPRRTSSLSVCTGVRPPSACSATSSRTVLVPTSITA